MTTNARQLRIGLIGHGFMGKVHSHAYPDFPFFFDTQTIPVLQAIAGRNEEKLKAGSGYMGLAILGN